MPISKTGTKGRGKVYNSIIETIGDTPLVPRPTASMPTCCASWSSSIRSRR
jgi:hypothetical protein